MTTAPKTPAVNWIDMETWPRREHFAAFANVLKCMIHTTVRLDVTNLYDWCKRTGHRVFPSTVVLVAEAANRVPEFRSVVADGKVGRWNYVSPVYSIWHDDTETFSSLCTEYDEDREAMYQAVVRDMERVGDARGYIVSDIPPNMLPTSCEPELDFESFHIQPVGDAAGHLQSVAPTIIWGKIVACDGRRRMPVSVSVSHAIADGYHLARFFEQLQKLFDAPDVF